MYVTFIGVNSSPQSLSLSLVIPQRNCHYSMRIHISPPTYSMRIALVVFLLSILYERQRSNEQNKKIVVKMFIL